MVMVVVVVVAVLMVAGGRGRVDGEGGRRRMMEASPLHATAVSSRQKAVCIIMGCHLISSGRGRRWWRCVRPREGKGREVIGVQSLAQIVFYRLSHLGSSATATDDRPAARVIEPPGASPSATPSRLLLARKVRGALAHLWRTRPPMHGSLSEHSCDGIAGSLRASG